MVLASIDALKFNEHLQNNHNNEGGIPHMLC